MPDPTTDMLTQNGSTPPPAAASSDPSSDPMSEMLGEHVGGLKGFARRYMAITSGQAYDASKMRYQAQQHQLEDLHARMDQYAGSGITSFFTPELQKYHKSIGGNPEMWDAAMQQAQAMDARRKQLREDHANLFGQYQQKYAPSAAGAGPAGPGASSPPSGGPSPAPTGGDATGEMLGGGAAPAATAGAPPTAGQTHWSDPSYDWASHKESPALAQMYGEMKELRQAAIDSEGLPEHEDIVKQLADSSKMYDKMLDMEMGFGQKTALATQSQAAALERTKEGHKAAGNASIQNENARLHAAVDAGALKVNTTGFDSQGEAEQAAALLNAQRRRANQHGTENGVAPVQQFYQAKQATHNRFMSDKFVLDPVDEDPTPAAQAKPEGGGGKSPAPKKIATPALQEGKVYTAPGKPDLIFKNGKLQVYDPNA